MTDAPIDADNVFVTFCGIYVERGASMSSDAGRVEKANGAAGRAARPEGFARTDAGRDERDTRLTRDAGSASDAGAASAARGKALASREGWLTISEACQTVDLLTLQGGITEALGIASLPHGQYGQIRLMLVDASLVIAGETHELVVPSGAEGGLKIGGGFTLGEGAATTITLDFDAAESIHHAAGRGYMMAPVIKIVAVKVHAKTVDDAGARLAE
jgi:hypothetical protein